MLSIVISTIVFFVATYYLRRYLDDMGIPRGMTQGTLIFSMALALAYVAALIAGKLLP